MDQYYEKMYAIYSRFLGWCRLHSTGWDDHRGVAVGLEPAPQGAPGAVMAGQFQGMLDPAHQVVGQEHPTLRELLKI